MGNQHTHNLHKTSYYRTISRSFSR